MKTTFGEWVRWTLARRGMDRSKTAALLGIAPKTVTSIYKRAAPDGVNDVTLARLAELLELTEPELMVKWRDGLPARPAKRPRLNDRGKR